MARTPTLAPVSYLDLIGFGFTLTLSWIDLYLSLDQCEALIGRDGEYHSMEESA